MNTTTATTTLICLFHDKDQADSTLRDLADAGVPKSCIGVMGDQDEAASSAAMDKWEVPQTDRKMLLDGINGGGVVIAVSAQSEIAQKVEDIFQDNQAGQVDEKTIAQKQPAAAPARDGGSLDVIKETLNVGKREVNHGGVRIFQRVTEKPVTQDITLREERVHVERQAVDRPATAADFTKDKSYEMSGSREEAVVSKSARVIEEVKLQKEESTRTEKIQDTLRNTDVVVEEIGAGAGNVAQKQTNR